MSSSEIVTVIGARPQFIKAAPVSRALAEAGVDETLVHTGQHFDANMSAVFFEELELQPPDHHLGISGGNHGAMTGRMLEAVEKVLLTERPECVVVYGDTNSTLAGALAAAKLLIPVAHVEAGLRSFNRRMPEEVNRILADHLAGWLFTPTDTATRNLRTEGIGDGRIFQVGDVMYDAALYFSELASKRESLVSALGLTPKGYVLATLHRQENTDDRDRLASIIAGLADVVGELPVVLPLHPRTRLKLDEFQLQLDPKITTIEPVGYLDMIDLERNAAVIATDSGGVQKEAYFYQVPCVTLREETEWNELVALGWNRLVSPTGGAVGREILAAIGSSGGTGQPYGDGTASKLLVEVLLAGLKGAGR